jgi:hypothetical protein
MSNAVGVIEYCLP